MSGGSSSRDAWSGRLEFVRPPVHLVRRPEDARLGEVVEFWQGDPDALRPGRAALVGFPQDEGVLRNHGRPGAAEAPAQIRQWLYRLGSWDGPTGTDLAAAPPLDLGDVAIRGGLEDSQEALAAVVDGILRKGAIPVVLGGGHETAYASFLGYAAGRRPVGIINLDAHLDLRPCVDGRGHSGSPFRQALEHPEHALPGDRYVCLGAQPHGVNRAQQDYAHRAGCRVTWAGDLRPSLESFFATEYERLVAAGCQVHFTLDADVVGTADVPGVSAPNPAGLAGREVIACARRAGGLGRVASLDLVEINPRYDRDDQSTRWAALVVWNFLVGLAGRGPV